MQVDLPVFCKFIIKTDEIQTNAHKTLFCAIVYTRFSIKTGRNSGIPEAPAI